MSESRKAFWSGVRAEFPLLVGVFPFGMIYGALALNAGLSTLASTKKSCPFTSAGCCPLPGLVVCPLAGED